MPTNTSTTQRIIELFQKYGHEEYGEGFHVLSHSFQAGLIARDKAYDNDLILSAFLHDIGHLYPLDKDNSSFETMGEFGIEAHDKWGEVFLQNEDFSDRIIAGVKNHVAAKRYLCFKDQAYYDQLSEASKQTLAYQGGPMHADEAAQFESDPFFEESILIRRIDEEAKEKDFEITEGHWTYFTSLLNEVTKPNEVS